MIKELGLQLYSIRGHLDTPEDTRASFKKLHDMGYTLAQTAGCPIGCEAFGRIAHEEGIAICGTHCSIDTLLADPQKAMDEHRMLGTTNMGIGGFFSDTMCRAEIEAFLDKVRRLTDAVCPEGFKFTYHNHSHEFCKYDGDKTMMDILVENLDPDKTSFVLDTYWVQHAGGDVCSWIEKLAGRIDILHLKDMGVNRDRQPFITEIGNGNMDFDKIIKTAEKTGVKYYVVEQDTCPGDPFESVKMSSEYIHTHFMK